MNDDGNAGRQERRLIVCADDFGMSPAVNRGVVRAHREGIVTETSLMVGGAGFEEAVRLTKEECPDLGVGLHLVLVQGRPVAPSDRIPSLVAKGGMFRRSAVLCGLLYFMRLKVREQLRTEIEAQIEALLERGIVPSHINGHLHIHMHPTVGGLVAEAAKKYGIPWVRFTREPILPALRFDSRDAARKGVEAAVFRVLSARMRRSFEAAGLRYPDRLFGLHQTGHISERYLLDVLERLPAGVTEIYGHPGFWDEEARRWRPAHYRPEEELAAFTSSRVRALLVRRGIVLTRFRELAPAP